MALSPGPTITMIYPQATAKHNHPNTNPTQGYNVGRAAGLGTVACRKNGEERVV